MRVGTAIFFGLSCASLIASSPSDGSADEVYSWHSMQLYCSGFESKAVALARGSWEGGDLHLPSGISALADGLDLFENGRCTLPDGRLIELNVRRLPFDLGGCGADPAATVSLQIDRKTVFEGWDFYSCHVGYSILAVVLDNDSLSTCTWLGRSGNAEAGSRMRFDDYECREKSDLLK
jgi:hypothetical protein